MFTVSVCGRVDLPDPEGPMMASESRSLTWTSTPAGTVVEPYFFIRP
jgi:hypothetical protein